MNLKKLPLILFAIGAATAFTNTTTAYAIPADYTPNKFLIFEAGGSYSYAFYKNHVTTAESVTPFTPGGVSINPSNFYPNNFWGGYIGLSAYIAEWLINTRYDMYGSKSKSNSGAGTDISLAPTRFSFTADKTWGCILPCQFLYGVGAGAVFETINKGEANIDLAVTNPPSESIQGRTRIDPLIEAFVMYEYTHNVGIKLNVAYQIPLNNKFSNGDLNVNLGINYALPI